MKMHKIDHILKYLPPTYAVEVMFSSCVCVCLFVCLSVWAINFERVDIEASLPPAYAVEVICGGSRISRRGGGRGPRRGAVDPEAATFRKFCMSK